MIGLLVILALLCLLTGLGVMPETFTAHWWVTYVGFLLLALAANIFVEKLEKWLAVRKPQ